jgi:hypothetical protein
VKGVGIFHQEFARAHNAKARPDFIPHLGLNLVHVQGKLFVAFYLVANQVGDDFLVGGAKAEIALVAVLYSQQFWALLFPAP